MEQQIKYIDANKILANKMKISVTIPQYIYDDLKEYERLTNSNTTDIVTNALSDFFRYKTVTNDDLLGYGNLYLNIPLTIEFKEKAIANKIKLNQDMTKSEVTEQIFISTVTNNLDVFNGVTYFAGVEYEKENIKHIGLDFKIIPTAIKLSKTTDYDKLNIDITDALYIFYYEVSSVNSIDVFLINHVDAVNRLSQVKSNKMNEKLMSCLQELEQYQKEINKRYSEEMQELHNNNKYVSNDKIIAIKDKYTAILLDVLDDIAIKFNSDKIKIGSDGLSDNLNKLNNYIDYLKNEHESNKRIIDYHEKK